MLGETAGLVAPIGAAAKAPQIAAGILKGQEAAAPVVANAAEDYLAKMGLLQPATVWHGSPHKFEKFDASKIGTGEGEQVYGYGLYLSQEPSVAMSYKEGLSRGKNAVLEGGGTKVELPPWLAERIKESPKELDNAIEEWSKRLSEEVAAKASSSQPWLVEERINI